MSLAFSPLNQLLLCSGGLDKQICFFNVKERVSVKNIKTDVTIAKVAFCQDGHTIAVGSDDGQLLVYDLRKSSTEVSKYAQGAYGPITALQFSNKSHEVHRQVVKQTLPQPDFEMRKQPLNDYPMFEMPSRINSPREDTHLNFQDLTPIEQTTEQIIESKFEKVQSRVDKMF